MRVDILVVLCFSCCLNSPSLEVQSVFLQVMCLLRLIWFTQSQAAHSPFIDCLIHKCQELNHQYDGIKSLRDIDSFFSLLVACDIDKNNCSLLPELCLYEIVGTC